MQVTRRSPFTGQYRTIDIPNLTQDMIDAWQAGALIQNAMPNVSVDHREFLISGMSPGEFDAALEVAEPLEDMEESEPTA